MSSYSKEELKQQILEMIQNDEQIRGELQKALDAKKRHWVVDVVSDVARMFFGAVIQRVVDMVAD